MICQQSEETEPDEDKIFVLPSSGAIASKALRVYSITSKCMDCAFYAVVYLYGHLPK